MTRFSIVSQVSNVRLRNRAGASANEADWHLAASVHGRKTPTSRCNHMRAVTWYKSASRLTGRKTIGSITCRPAGCNEAVSPAKLIFVCHKIKHEVGRRGARLTITQPSSGCKLLV